jgi:2-oxoglutarate dehydrogenase E2 component (dihydrolipoamide succinyltransferase)
MAKFEVVMPKLGESIIEATITKWMKAVGETISEDEPIVEIATDKVDSEIPSPVEGVLKKLLYKEGDIVPVGEIIAIIQMGDDDGSIDSIEDQPVATVNTPEAPAQISPEQAVAQPFPATESASGRFYSPLVRNIARQENIPMAELDSLAGTGKEGRLTKEDLLNHLKSRGSAPAASTPAHIPVAVATGAGDQVIEMDRMRKLIADHMVNSVKISPHVTSFVEVDMTNIVAWRNKQKDLLMKRDNEKLTYTHVFLEVMARAVKDYPMVNSSVDGNKIIIRKNINIGMAVALPSGNLIVPVIRNADQMNMLGLVKKVNDIADRARNNKLVPDEIQGGTITLTNLGSFGTLMGTPIINQPQTAIIAVGSITKRPVVLETPQGDVIAIRNMMYLSISYDHRVIDGALGGKFIYRMKEYLESFDPNQGI